MTEVAIPMSMDVSISNAGNEFSNRSNEFDYRPVPPLAVTSLITGILSLSGLLTEFALPLAVVGCVLGLLGMRLYVRFPGEYSGKALPVLGFMLSIACLLGGSALHAYTFVTELPEGYRRVNFTADISKKGFVETEGKPDFNADVKELDGQKIFIKGFMYPEGKQKGIRKFLLVRDSGACCFGGQPALQDMIEVQMNEDAADAVYREGMVAVGGVFRLGDMKRAGSLTPAYVLDATHFGLAKKRY